MLDTSHDIQVTIYHYTVKRNSKVLQSRVDCRKRAHGTGLAAVGCARSFLSKARCRVPKRDLLGFLNGGSTRQRFCGGSVRILCRSVNEMFCRDYVVVLSEAFSKFGGTSLCRGCCSCKYDLGYAPWSSGN